MKLEIMCEFLWHFLGPSTYQVKGKCWSTVQGISISTKVRYQRHLPYRLRVPESCRTEKQEATAFFPGGTNPLLSHMKVMKGC